MIANFGLHRATDRVALRLSGRAQAVGEARQSDKSTRAMTQNRSARKIRQIRSSALGRIDPYLLSENDPDVQWGEGSMVAAAPFSDTGRRERLDRWGGNCVRCDRPVSRLRAWRIPGRSWRSRSPEK